MGYAQPVQFPPGQGYYYSNTNTVLLGVIIEQLTGMPVAEAFQQRIFDPLGLTETSFPAITDATVPDPHPTFYTWGTNVGTIDSTVMSPEVQAAALDGSSEPIDTTDLNPSWGWTAGAAISTAEDLADFVEALAGGGLLSPELQAKRMTELQPDEARRSYERHELRARYRPHRVEVRAHRRGAGYQLVHVLRPRQEDHGHHLDLDRAGSERQTAGRRAG